MDAAMHRTGMSGSRVAAIFGCHPFLSEFGLWDELKYGTPPDDYRPDERKLLGQCLEPGILDVWGRINGRTVRPNSATIRHPTHELVIGTPDGFVEGEERGIDAKVVAPDQSRKWGIDADDIPHHITMQAMWYMLLTGYSEWIIAALVGGWLRFYTITRNLDAENAMLTRVEEWWERYIIGNDRPDFGPSKEANRWLQRMYPVHRAGIREAEPGELALLNSYVINRMAVKNLERDLTEQASQIKELIGDGEGIRWGESHITWRKPKDSQTTDWKGMSNALLNEYVLFTERAAWEERFAKLRKSSRRFLLTHPDVVDVEAA